MGEKEISRNVNVISDENGKSIVLINDVRFRTRRTIDWKQVEEVSAIEDLIRIATNKSATEDFDKRHKSKAKYGWYRYDTRFGIPSYNSDGELVQYSIYTARMLVRCDKDGKLYLYDFVRTKKETSSPSEQ